MTCPACGAPLAERDRPCSTCGVLDGVDAVTRAPAPGAVRVASSHSLDHARFIPGTMLAGRYRIVALLGRGGMGEVYRAEDLTLGQLVALKFLPTGVADDPDRLARFHQEVRVARQVSHPNVCRVYDIGEADGHLFISMEFVDGEDLSSLMRRIGRLPAGKALELARQLCAGLAAAHDRGVVHRDLKPANVMIDGRGRARIADFGLAGLVDDGRDRQGIAGTPGYMAPEQFAGQGTSTRSDVYALGLVMYELFTGKAAIATSETDPLKRLAALANPPDPARPSSLAADIDPAVERVILRCLERDPARRPDSAIAVASALPGGDPLAAALAAGDTPSPEMVAAAGETDSIAMRTIGVCVVAIAIGLTATVMMRSATGPLRQTPFEQTPAALEQKARDLIRLFGYTDPPTDRAFGMVHDIEFRDWAEREEPLATFAAQQSKGQPATIVFWYRQSPLYLDVMGSVGPVSRTDPPMVTSGMVGVSLDMLGRLVQLDAVPPQVEESPLPAPTAADWSALLTAAGLDMSRFASTEPTWVPLTPFDVRAAWTGSFAHAPDVPMRVEAAAWRGKPVYFQVIGPWTRPTRMQPAPSPAQPLAQLVLVIVIAVAVLLTWRSVKQARADLRGASRLALFVFACSMLGWLLSANHVPTGVEFLSFVSGVSWALLIATTVWCLYVALEPLVRKRWPESLISWSQLLAGHVRHPLVGGHVLIGVAFGVAYALLLSIPPIAGFGEVGHLTALNAVADLPRMLDVFVRSLMQSVGLALGMFFFYCLLKSILRREWLAAIVFALTFASPASLSTTHYWIHVSAAVVQYGLVIVVLTRFGLLPMIVSIAVDSDLRDFPLTTDFSTWYAGSTMFILAVVLALTGYAVYTAVAGRPLVKDGLLEGV